MRPGIASWLPLEAIWAVKPPPIIKITITTTTINNRFTANLLGNCTKCQDCTISHNRLQDNRSHYRYQFKSYHPLIGANFFAHGKGQRKIEARSHIWLTFDPNASAM